MDPMLTKSRFALSLSALALTCAAPAMAQVTASELWAEWQTQSASQGQALAAAQVATTGSGLQLTDVTTVYSDADVSATTRVAGLTLTENGDGTVSVSVIEPYSVEIEFETGTPGQTGLIELLVAFDGFDMQVGGTQAARSYSYAANSVTITAGRIEGHGETPEIDVLISMDALAAAYTVDGTDPNNLGYDSTGSLGSMSAGVSVAPEDRSEGELKMIFGITDLTSSGGGNLGNFATVAANPGTMPEGFDFDAELGYSSVALESDFRDGRDVVVASYTNDGGGFMFDFSETSLAYGFNTQNAALYAEAPDLPVPVEASVGSAEFAFEIPLSATGAPEPFAARFAYQDVTMSDALWGMADPMQAVPRDPVSLVLDISGTAQLMVDLMTIDPNGIDAPPGELRSLTINELRLGFGGAELSGSGDMTFAAGQMVPMPVGSVDLELAGAFALMDRLEATGIIPIEQLAMARGMIGAFARPGAMPDTLESTIEFTPGGGITANGVPLQ